MQDAYPTRWARRPHAEKLLSTTLHTPYLAEIWKILCLVCSSTVSTLLCANCTAAVPSAIITITFNSCKTASTSSMALATVNIDKIILCIMRGNVSKNATCGRDEQRKKRRKLSWVKLAICPDHRRRHSPLKFCMLGRVRDVVIYFKFHENRLRGLGAVEGRKSPSPIDKAMVIQQLVLPYKPWYTYKII